MAREKATDAFQTALQADDPVALYERAPCGYLSTDADGRIVKANQTFLTLCGYEHDELVGRPMRDLLTPGGQIFELTHLQPMLRMQGEAREIALDFVRGDGELLPVLLNAMLDTTEGQVPMVRIAVFDATERRRYERELMSAKDRAEESERRARTLALTLQETLIPAGLPQIPGLAVAAAYRPSGDGTEVGGDFYDLFPVGDDSWALLVGDVCGKGAEVVGDEMPQVLQRVGVSQHLNQQLPLDASFVDDTGKTVRLGDYFGKHPAILSLVYYNCPCCVRRNWTD